MTLEYSDGLVSDTSVTSHNPGGWEPGLTQLASFPLEKMSKTPTLRPEMSTAWLEVLRAVQRS